MYNIHNYLLERKKVFFMALDQVLSRLNGDSVIDVLPVAHKSILKIKEKPFYIGTNFKQIGESSNARFMLVSAPGATGKSAFGKYVAYTKNALYWNLAEISIGDGTFQGTLYRALGVSKISNYASLLQSGKATLVVDAFDEAEIISGRKNIYTFLQEANEFLEDSEMLSIVLLSRTETAQSIATFFSGNNIPFVHYEIDYFPESSAKEFVLEFVKTEREVTVAIEKCVDEYFERVKELITEKNALNRFIGYAPVLEAIAKHIIGVPNTSKLLSDLKDGANETSIVAQIMETLLWREQNKKFVPAFKEKLKEDVDKITNWEEIYSAEEQLIRVLNYILMGEVSYEDYKLTALPEYLIDDYCEIVKLFLPQHPFIQNSFKDKTEASVVDFAGPAFRDYSLASIMLNSDNEVSAELYYQREESTAHFPSQIFWDHYIDMSEKRIKSNHFSYLFEAYKSKTTVGYQTYLDIFQEEEETYAAFWIAKDDDIADEDCMKVDIINNEFKFDSIKNTSISVDGTVIIGNGDHANIAESTVFCKNLIINANTLSVEAYAPSITTICSETPMKPLAMRMLNVLTTADGEIRIDVPNITEFPKLVRYKHTISWDAGEDIYVFIHYLRKIFSSFRTHKKDMPAKDAEKIDFVVIAGNQFKKDIFDFLCYKNIIFKAGHLYKIDLGKMSEYGISWGALTLTDTTQLEKVYNLFCAWLDERVS